MRLMVCGGAKFNDHGLITRSLDAVQRKRPMSLLIHGNASVPDFYAKEWAERAGVPHTGMNGFPDYRRFEPFERIRAMLRISLPDGIVAFPGAIGLDQITAKSGVSSVTVWQPTIKKTITIPGPKWTQQTGVPRAVLRRQWYHGAVYVIGSLRDGGIFGPFKVGRIIPLSTIQDRIAALQTASPHPLIAMHVVGADISSAAVEKLAHGLLRAYRLKGEWFNCTLFEAMRAVNLAKEQELSPSMWPNRHHKGQVTLETAG